MQLHVGEQISRSRQSALAQLLFILAVFLVLLQAKLLETGTHEPSTLDGLYAPVLFLLTSYVLIYLDGASLRRFVADSVILQVVLNSLPLIKYRFLNGADVNYMYRIIRTAGEASSYGVVEQMPSLLNGIYPNFPGFIVLNVAFIKITGLATLVGYKLLFPIVYGTLYVTAFYMLSGTVTSSAALRRAIVMIAVVPYALLPAQVWNYYMMPIVFAFLIFLHVLWMTLAPASAFPRTRESKIALVLLLFVITISHPLVGLYTASTLSGLQILRKVLSRRSPSEGGYLLSLSLVLVCWFMIIGWTLYSSVTQPFFSEALELAIAILSGGVTFPPVTQRLQTAGIGVFLITHISKIALGLLAVFGLVGILRRKILEAHVGLWTLAASGFVFLSGLMLFAPSYSAVDIYVGYRSLFLCMIVLTLVAGLGLFWLTKIGTARPARALRKTLRSLSLGVLLLMILAGSLFELYPTEYVNPTVSNSVHTVYQKNAIDFLNAYWIGPGQIVVKPHTYQVAQSDSSLQVYSDIVHPRNLPYIRLRDPLTTITDTEDFRNLKVNVIYSSGFIVINSTLR